MKTEQKGQDGPDGFFVVPVNVTIKAFDRDDARAKVLGSLDMNLDVQNVVTKAVRPAADSDMDGFDHLLD